MTHEISRRRTFAIISHPDAGKTTLTEKLLLYGGALHLAGTVKARKNQRSTASDWMELEKKRGISISSTVLQFDYQDFRLNLLDTPGHNDFSQDTYRVLTAVDAVIMVIDAAKGIESRTRKLFEACRLRRVPIFTFINKMDRPAKDPLELIDELERDLDLDPCPINWPIGDGTGFKGVYDRTQRQVHLFERTVHGAHQAPVAIHDPSDLKLNGELDAAGFEKVTEEIDVLDLAGSQLDPEAVLRGTMTPVFFGSALNNFGVQLLLESFLNLSPPPAARRSAGEAIDPSHPAFSGFVFKVQGNMDPKHRDHLAFIRVCSGRFERDMLVHHSGTGKKVKLAYSHRLFGQERVIVDEAFPGDVVGVVGHPEFRIGDTLSLDGSILYNEIPNFPPECFVHLHNPSPSKSKPFRKGLDQLLVEGCVQAFFLNDALTSAPLIAAVGPLQFEVMQYRLDTEYGVETRLEPAPWKLVRWVDEATAEKVSAPNVLPSAARTAKDALDQDVVLFADDWSLRYFQERNPEFDLYDVAPQDRAVVAALSEGTVFA